MEENQGSSGQAPTPGKDCGCLRREDHDRQPGEGQGDQTNQRVGVQLDASSDSSLSNQRLE